MNENQQADFYANNPGKAVSDFCLGFFGIWIVLFVFNFAIGLLSNVFSIFYGGFFVFSILIYMVLGVSAVVVARSTGRRYIGIGILSSFLIPVLIFGACMVVLGGL